MSSSKIFLTDPPQSRGWSIFLWALQLLLAILYAFSGFVNLFMSPEQLIAMSMGHAKVLPYALVRIIGLVELLGALGLLLPAAFRILPKLTSYAAFGFVLLQIFAMIYHIGQHELFILPINTVLLSVAALIWWGRTYKAVILPASLPSANQQH